MNSTSYTHRLAVNAFLIFDEKFLILKRAARPLIWGPPGGRLNQDEGGPLPRDVTEDLRVLGLNPCNDVMEMIGEADRLP